MHNSHGPLLPVLQTKSYGCSCGCGTCGDSYAGSYGIIPLVPAALIVGAIGQFEGYNFNEKWYAACPEYQKAVDAFGTFREKVVRMYGKKPRASVFLGGTGKKFPSAENPNLRSEGAAQSRLKVLKSQAKNVLKICKGQYKAGQKGLTQEDIDAASLETEEAGGSNLMLYSILGVSTLAGIGMIAFALSKPKKPKKQVA